MCVSVNFRTLVFGPWPLVLGLLVFNCCCRLLLLLLRYTPGNSSCNSGASSTRSLPAFLATYSALSLAEYNDRSELALPGQAATPILTVTGPTSSTSSFFSTSRNRSAAAAPFSPFMPASNRANSSPPRRAAVSLSRETLANVLATWRMTKPPPAGPTFHFPPFDLTISHQTHCPH